MIWRLSVWGVVATLALGSSPAFALQTGQCLPAAQARATLAAEKQNPIIVGNRTGYGYKTALIFTANEDGSEGYLMRGDKPLGEQATTVCVDSVYRDVRLNDISKPGIPAWAKMAGNAVTAEAVCKRDRLGYQENCNFHNDSIVVQNQNGQRVMFSAIGTAINPRDKTMRKEQRLTVTLSIEEPGGLVKATTVEGASYMLAAYTSAAYTQHGKALLPKD